MAKLIGTIAIVLIALYLGTGLAQTSAKSFNDRQAQALSIGD